MRVLYVAPRFHTNQIPVVKGWLENGHQVLFLSQFADQTEDYSVLEPIILGYSKVFELLIILHRWLFHRGKKSVKWEYDMRIKIGFPPLSKMCRLVKEFAPDIIILRERSIYNIPVYLYGRSIKGNCLLYNQSPLWDYPDRDKGLLKRILISLLPNKRITPVYGVPEKGKTEMPASYYVPFVACLHRSPVEKRYFRDGKIHVLCVGRYEERKNHLLLVDALKDLLTEGKLELVIAGEMVDREQKVYYSRLLKYIKEGGAEPYVKLLTNLSMDRIYLEYERADLFVLPSTRERASVSQLEAMGCSIPVICSNTNGSACYVESGVNGYLFRDNDKIDLQEKIVKIISDEKELVRMGGESYRLASEKYNFQSYFNRIMKIIGETE